METGLGRMANVIQRPQGGALLLRRHTKSRRAARHTCKAVDALRLRCICKGNLPCEPRK